MINMKIGDVIFVPRIPDKNKFTVFGYTMLSAHCGQKKED
jgi:hypothetical protein